jgi:hypothetical protein
MQYATSSAIACPREAVIEQRELGRGDQQVVRARPPATRQLTGRERG